MYIFGRTFVSALLSWVVIYILTSAYLLITDSTTDGTDLLIVLFYGTFIIGGSFFALLCVLNFLIQWRMTTAANRNMNRFYFFLASLIALVTIFGFVLFDYNDRGRLFEEKNFFDFVVDYSSTFIFAAIAIFINRKVTWNNFKKVKPADPKTGQ